MYQQKYLSDSMSSQIISTMYACIYTFYEYSNVGQLVDTNNNYMIILYNITLEWILYSLHALSATH